MLDLILSSSSQVIGSGGLEFIGFDIDNIQCGKGRLVDRHGVVMGIELDELKLGQRLVMCHKVAVDAVHDAAGDVTRAERRHLAKPLAGLVDGKFEELLGEFLIGHGLGVCTRRRISRAMRPAMAVPVR